MKKIYHGYYILAACFFIMVLAYGSQFCFGVFFNPLVKEFGWSRAVTSGPFALNQLIGGICSIITGRFTDKIGTRRVVLTGSIILGLGYILTSSISSLPLFYVTYGVIVAVGTSAMYVPVVALLTRWFPQKAGSMAGISISGIGFGIGVLPIIAASLVQAFGWRLSMLIVGTSAMVLILALSLALKEPETTRSSVSGQPPRKDYSFDEAVHTSQFWMFCIAWIFYGFIYQVPLVHIVPHGIDLGMSATAAAVLLTVIGLVGTPGRVAIGFSGDKFGNRRVFIASYAITGTVYLFLFFLGSVGTLFGFAVVYGAFNGVGILLAPIAAEYYGYKSLGSIVGAVIFANCIGNALGPPIAGAIYDSTNSYNLAFLICGILGFGAALIVWRLKNPKTVGFLKANRG